MLLFPKRTSEMEVSFTDSEACQTIAVSCPMDQFEGIMYGEKMRRGLVGKVGVFFPGETNGEYEYDYASR